MRDRLEARLAIGLVLGLIVGYGLAAPYARHQERNIAELREEANAERYRPTVEAQELARTLDAQADQRATNAFIKMMTLWIFVAAVVGGGIVLALSS